MDMVSFLWWYFKPEIHRMNEIFQILNIKVVTVWILLANKSTNRYFFKLLVPLVLFLSLNLNHFSSFSWFSPSISNLKNYTTICLHTPNLIRKVEFFYSKGKRRHCLSNSNQVFFENLITLLPLWIFNFVQKYRIPDEQYSFKMQITELTKGQTN